MIKLDCDKSNLNRTITANVLKDTCGAFIPYITEILNHSYQLGNLLNDLTLFRLSIFGTAHGQWGRKSPIGTVEDTKAM